MIQKNIFRTLPPAPGAEPWGLVVTGAGYCKSHPGDTYPPDRYSADRMYEWDSGRVLPVFQIVGLLQGRGELESNIAPPQWLVADSAFLIAPGQWHRFRPDLKIGWTEIWIEFQGLVPTSLSSAGQLGRALVVRTGAEAAGLWEAMDAVLQRVCCALPGINPSLTAMAMEAIAAWSRLSQAKKVNVDVSHALSTAVETLNRQYRTAIDLEELAKNVGMSYSVFRHAFSKHTGFAPWQYVRRMRLTHARHRLARSGESLSELADNLGFSSSFHLSIAFRKEFGISPSQWRKTAKQRAYPEYKEASAKLREANHNGDARSGVMEVARLQWKRARGDA